ncbi:hypothetical protein BGW80DRAFT_1252895 [Lactifluus volemus]|nr:hypothetical protein BGW80DRAFT_1252895 [Lactifluus volemus]
MIMGGRAKAHHSASEMATPVLINLEVRTIIDVNNIFRFHNMRTCLAVLFVLVLTTLGAAKPFDKELAANAAAANDLLPLCSAVTYFTRAQYLAVEELRND